MIKNFIEKDPSDGDYIDYSKPLDLPLVRSQQPAPPKTGVKNRKHSVFNLVKRVFLATRKDMDEVPGLPGLTFETGFKQYSGYLKGNVTGNYLHYWHTKAQTNEDTAPLVLWLTGGPGCSRQVFH
jgi:carboxypeptidase C (cathepsin A)